MTRRTFKTGTRNQAFRNMVDCAIRDRLAMADACTPDIGDPDASLAQDRQQALDEVHDFKLLAWEKGYDVK